MTEAVKARALVQIKRSGQLVSVPDKKRYQRI